MIWRKIMSSNTHITKSQKSQFFYAARRTTITKSDLCYIVKIQESKKTTIPNLSFCKEKAK